MSANPTKKRHTNIPASYIVLLDGTKTLLIRRFNTGYEDGNYGLVSGHVDEGENFSKALIREAYEEAGITLEPSDIEVAHVMHRYSKTRVGVEVFFVATNWKGKPKNNEPHKCDDISWFEMDDLPENMVPFVRQAIEHIKNKIYYSEYGWE